MARKPTDKQLFKMKNEWMGQFYEEVSPRDFYREVFPEGSFERKGCLEDSKSNGVVTVIDGEKARNYLVFDDLETIDDIKGTEFAIMSPVGYSGRNRTAKNARWLYGIGIDLYLVMAAPQDGLLPRGLMLGAQEALPPAGQNSQMLPPRCSSPCAHPVLQE